MISLFLGVPGSGKTLAAQNVTAIASQQWPCFVVDHTPEEWAPNFEGRPNPRWYGNAPRIITVPHMPNEEALEFLADYDTGIFRFCLGDGWEQFEVATLVKLRGDAYYVDDEIDRFAEYKDWRSSPLNDFVHRGRHLPNAEGVSSEVHVIGCARRVQNLHADLTSMANEAYVFRSQGVRTLSRLRDEGYIEPGDESEVRHMPDLHFIHWRNSGTITRGSVVPANWA